MKNLSTFCRLLFVFCSIVLIFGCTRSNTSLPTPEIQIGNAKIIGKVTNFSIEKDIIITVQLGSLFSDQYATYETVLNEDGRFFFDVPVECSGIAAIYSRIFRSAICLIPNEETHLEITFDDAGQAKVSMNSSLGLTAEDLENSTNIIYELIELNNDKVNERDVIPLDSMLPEVYSEWRMQRVKKDLAVIKNNPKLSEKAQLRLYYIMKLIYLEVYFMDYEENMRNRYFDKHIGEDINEEDFTPIKPDKSYYSFLKDFDLNNPLCLYAPYYPIVLQSILKNEILNLPIIGDSPIDGWLKDVKAIMADLIGADTGLFYEMLVAQAYIKQFNEDQKPLSDKQKENITKYFKNKSYTKILFSEHDKIVIDIENLKNSSFLKINETPAVPKEKLMDAIVANYPGKVVLVDFWATWCGPCLAAMKQSTGLKSEMKDNVAFVYIAGTSSPKEEWEKRIPQIGGEHYYLTEEELEYIYQRFSIEGIPAYLLYDTEGRFYDKFIGYPGTEKMKKTIKEILSLKK